MARDRPKSARGDRRRSQILHAAVDCLVKDGWAGLTHRRVGQRAGANPALLQYYFGDLAGLREEVARSASDGLTSALAHSMMSTETLDELVEACVHGISGITSQPDQVRLLVQILVGTAYHPEVAAIVRAELVASKAAVAQHLMTLDPSREHSEAAAAADLFVAAADGVMLHALTSPDVSVTQNAARLTALLRVILAPDTPRSAGE